MHIKFRQPLAYFVVSNSYRDATCLEIVLTPDQPFISSFQNVCHALLWDQYIMRSVSFIFSYSWYELSRVVQVIMILTFVWELPDYLIISIPTILTGGLNWFTWSLQTNTGIVSQTEPRLFVSLSFQFTLYYHLYGWPSLYTWLLITTALILHLFQFNNWLSSGRQNALLNCC